MERMKLLIVVCLFILSVSLCNGAKSNVKDDEDDTCMKCNVEGTEYCEDGYCQCSKSFMGPLCKIKRNPCVEAYKIPPGKESCGQGERGDCIPELGTERYSCICKDKYKDNAGTPYPDCVFDQETADENKILGMNKAAVLGIAVPVIFLFLLIWGVAAAVGIRFWLRKREQKAKTASSSTSLKRSKSNASRRSYSSLIRQSQESLEQPYSD